MEAYFEKMNQRLTSGYKLSNFNCESCTKGTVMIHPENRTTCCTRCEFVGEVPGEVAIQNSGDDFQDNEQQFEEKVVANIKAPQEEEEDNSSQKIGEYLLKGWTMIDMHCDDCFNPIMRSRKGEHICVKCGPVDVNQQNSRSRTTEPKPAPFSLTRKQEIETEDISEVNIQTNRAPVLTDKQRSPSQVQEPRISTLNQAETVKLGNLNIPATDENLATIHRQIELERSMALLSAIQEIRSRQGLSMVEKHNQISALK